MHEYHAGERESAEIGVLKQFLSRTTARTYFQGWQVQGKHYSEAEHF